MSDQNKRLGITVGAGLVGAFFGNAGLGLAVGAAAGGLIFPGPDPAPKIGPRLGDSQVQVSAYGAPFPIIYGKTKVAGNVIWSTKIREVARKNSSSAGGKGGGPKQQAFTFEYFISLAITLCANEIVGIKRVWADDQVYFDFNTPIVGNNFAATVYTGTETQLPDPTIEASEGVGRVPAFRGLAYIVIRDLPLTQFGKRVPTFHFEVVANGAPILETQSIADPVGFIGGAGKMALDEESGFIWAPRNINSVVRVVSCDQAFTLVKEIPFPGAYQASWQPKFLTVDTIPVVSLDLPREVRARVWVAPTIPDAIGGRIAGIRTDGSYQEDQSDERPFDGSFTSWTGPVLMDIDSINLVGPQAQSPTLLYSTSNLGVGQGVVTVDPIDPGGGQNLSWPSYGINRISDWISAGGFIWGIDDRSIVFKLRGDPGGLALAPADATVYLAVKRVEANPGAAFDVNSSITYDPEEKMIYTTSTSGFSATTLMHKWNEELELQWVVTFPKNLTGFEPSKIRYHKGIGDIWVLGRDFSAEFAGFLAMKRIDKQTGEFVQELKLDVFADAQDLLLYPFSNFAVAILVNAITKIPLNRGALANPPTLSSVISDLCLRTKTLTANDIDVTDLPDSLTLEGFVVSNRTPIRASLETLLKYHFIDAVESDGKIKFFRRGKSPVLTIAKEHLAARAAGAEPPEPIAEVRTQEIDLVRQLDGRYPDVDNDYKMGVQIAKRLTGDSQQIRTEDIPIVFSGDSVKAIVEVLVHNMWFERDPKTIVVPRVYAKIDPGDVVILERPDGETVTVRVSQTEYGLPQLIQMEVMEEEITVYSGFNFPGQNTLAPQPGLITFPPLLLVLMDAPTLRDSDDGPGLYAAVYSLSSGFQFGEVLKSSDQSTYTGEALLDTEAGVGFAEEVLAWEGSIA